jgi:hypothetical protein
LSLQLVLRVLTTLRLRKEGRKEGKKVGLKERRKEGR